MSLAIADPDLRMEKTGENPYGWSLPQKLTVTLNGRWHVKESAKYTARDTEIPEIQFTPDGNTLFIINCKDGMTNEYLLENEDNPLLENVKNTFICQPGSDTVYVNGEQVNLQYAVTQKDNTDFIALSDMADMLNASLRKNTAENRMECYYDSKQIIFTLNSQIATIDNEIVILPQAVYEENGTYFVPLSVLSDILDAEPENADGNIVYTQTEASWINWNKEPSEPDGFVFTAGNDGTSVLMPPESINEGIFVMAVYKDGILQKLELKDLSISDADRSLQYVPEEGNNAEVYSVKGFLFEDMESMKPMLTRCLIYENN